MDATRPRLSFTNTNEVLTTAAPLAWLLLLGLLTVRELRVLPRALSVESRPPSSAAASVPPDVVSLPALILGPAQEIRVGDRRDDVLRRLTGSITALANIEERGPLGTREVRWYQHDDMQFIVVLEPFDRGAEPRVAALYMP